MRRSAMAVGVLVASSLMVPIVGGGSTAAAEKKAEYTSPDSIKKVLLKEPLHGVKGEQVTVLHITFPAGWVGGKHYHSGPVYVYVLKGTFTIREKGKKPQELAAGTLYREEVGHPMVARNPSTSEATEALVMEINRKGEPLMIKTDF